MNITQLKIFHEQLASDIKFLIYKSAIYHDKRRKKKPYLKKSDKIYLFKKILKFKGQAANSITLSSVFSRLKKNFFINYELELLQDI